MLMWRKMTGWPFSPLLEEDKHEVRDEGEDR
jgi:hypothetical protein